MVATTNRVMGLAKNHVLAPTTNRTAAQRRASRTNGRRSRGPITAAGKQRSSQNATKHSLLSVRFTPIADPRGDDRLYGRVRAELVEQFSPTTFIAGLMIDMLAADIVQLARCRAMIEEVQKQPLVSHEDLKDYRRLREARRDLKAVQQALRRLTAGLPFDSSPRAAAYVAACIAETFKGVHDYINTEDGLTVDQMDEHDRREFAEYDARWQTMRRHERKLVDVLHLADVARGVVKPTPGERRAIHTALTQSELDLTRVIRGREKFEATMVRRQDESLSALARSPERLILLQRYAVRIERAITRKLAELRRQ